MKGDLRQKCEEKINLGPWIKDIKKVIKCDKCVFGLGLGLGLI